MFLYNKYTKFLFALKTDKVKHNYTMLARKNPLKIGVGRVYCREIQDTPKSPIDALYRKREDGHFSEGEGVIFA